MRIMCLPFFFILAGFSLANASNDYSENNLDEIPLFRHVGYNRSAFPLPDNAEDWTVFNAGNSVYLASIVQEKHQHVNYIVVYGIKEKHLMEIARHKGQWKHIDYFSSNGEWYIFAWETNYLSGVEDASVFFLSIKTQSLKLVQKLTNSVKGKSILKINHSPPVTLLSCDHDACQMYLWTSNHSQFLIKENFIIPVTYPQALSVFHIREQLYMAVINLYRKKDSQKSRLSIYKLNENSILLVQTIENVGSYITQFCHDVVQDTEYFLLLNYLADSKESVIYKWADGYFIPFQNLKITNVVQWLPVPGDAHKYILLSVRTSKELFSFQYNGWEFVRTPAVFRDENTRFHDIRILPYNTSHIAIVGREKGTTKYEASLYEVLFVPDRHVEELHGKIAKSFNEVLKDLLSFCAHTIPPDGLSHQVYSIDSSLALRDIVYVYITTCSNKQSSMYDSCGNEGLLYPYSGCLSDFMVLEGPHKLTGIIQKWKGGQGEIWTAGEFTFVPENGHPKSRNVKYIVVETMIIGDGHMCTKDLELIDNYCLGSNEHSTYSEGLYKFYLDASIHGVDCFVELVPFSTYKKRIMPESGIKSSPHNKQEEDFILPNQSSHDPTTHYLDKEVPDRELTNEESKSSLHNSTRKHTVAFNAPEDTIVICLVKEKGKDPLVAAFQRYRTLSILKTTQPMEESTNLTYEVLQVHKTNLRLVTFQSIQLHDELGLFIQGGNGKRKLLTYIAKLNNGSVTFTELPLHIKCSAIYFKGIGENSCYMFFGHHICAVYCEDETTNTFKCPSTSQIETFLIGNETAFLGYNHKEECVKQWVFGQDKSFHENSLCLVKCAHKSFRWASVQTPSDHIIFEVCNDELFLHRRSASYKAIFITNISIVVNKIIPALKPMDVINLNLINPHEIVRVHLRVSKTHHLLDVMMIKIPEEISAATPFPLMDFDLILQKNKYSFLLL